MIRSRGKGRFGGDAATGVTSTRLPLQLDYPQRLPAARLTHSICPNRFARESRPYQPPEDLKERFDRICTELFGEPANEKVLQIKLNDPVIKYKVGQARDAEEHFESKRIIDFATRPN